MQKNYLKAVGKGVLKVMSKMGISTYQSYCGAQIFDAVGLSSGFVEKCFTGTATHHRRRRLRGDRARGGAAAIATPMATTRSTHGMLDAGGDYAFRLRGEDHAWTPDCVAKLQHAVRGNIARRVHRAFTAIINDQSERLLTLRGLMELEVRPTRRCRWTRSSRRRRSSSGSPPAR